MNPVGNGRGCEGLNRRLLAKTLSEIENRQLIPKRHEGLIIAFTGSPGVGKSCLIDRLIYEWSTTKTIAVLAVDPTSPLSGGALLGDRIRMTVLDEPELGKQVYFRSVATRESSGSVPSIVGDLASHLFSEGFDMVLVETVGAGQSEMRCAALANKIIVVEGPSRGDIIQAEKAGLLELADLVVVNKSDLPGASKVAHEIQSSLNLTDTAPNIVLASAQTGEGIEELAEKILLTKSSVKTNRARIRERILMWHENKLLHRENFDYVIKQISSGELSFEEGLVILSD